MKFTRYSAFLFHMLISTLVAACVMLLIFWIWYPSALAPATGVHEIVLIALFVDVVIGPCLTFVVFKAGKPGLKFDLCAIAGAQILAMSLGISTLAQGRPAYLVFNVDRFDLVYANDLTEEKLKAVKDPAFKRIPLMGPQVVSAKFPESAAVRSEVTLQALLGGDDLPQLPKFYIPYEHEAVAIRARLKPISELRKYNAGNLEELDHELVALSHANQRIAYLPVRGKNRDVTAVVDRSSLRVIDTIDFLPW